MTQSKAQVALSEAIENLSISSKDFWDADTCLVNLHEFGVVMEAIKIYAAQGLINAIPDVWDGKYRRVDDGVPLKKSVIVSSKKTWILKAKKEGLSARAAGRIFDVTHDMAAKIYREG